MLLWRGRGKILCVYGASWSSFFSLKHKALELKSGTQDSPFSIAIKYSTWHLRLSNKTTEGDQKGNSKKKEIKAPLLADDVIVYINDPKTSTGKLLQLLNTLSNAAGYKIYSQKSISVASYIQRTYGLRKKIKETTPWTSSLKK